MSVQNEITRLSNAADAIKVSIQNKGVAVPAGSKLDDMPALIDAIQTSGGAYNIISTDNGDGTQDIDIVDASGSFIVTPLSVTENGTYTAPFGAAYTPVTVNVPTGEPVLQDKTVSPSESQQLITADSGYDGLDTVTVNAISSTYVGSGVARKSSVDLTINGAIVFAPPGYYSAEAAAMVSSGNAGTPTASKGTVSNHSISITPSVTNTTGYITGGTKTGTAVTVSASELVSGSETKTANGTYNVTNLASLVVAIPTYDGSVS